MAIQAPGYFAKSNSKDFMLTVLFRYDGYGVVLC